MTNRLPAPEPPAAGPVTAKPDPAARAGPRRLEQLDSLRGLAALSVVFCHLVYVFPAAWDSRSPADLGGNWFLKLLLHSPANILVGGHSAVVFFFVLSGFVLALPFLRGSPPSYRAFLIKRVLRIYPPYLVAVVAGFAACWIYPAPWPSDLSLFIRHIGTIPPNWRVFFQHALLVDSFPHDDYNPVLWSLVHEMRISLVFPFLMLLVIRLPWAAALGAGLLLGAGDCAWYALKGGGAVQVSDWHLTLQLVFCFIAGALLARHRVFLAGRCKAMGPVAMWAVLVCGCLAYTAQACASGLGSAGGTRIWHLMRYDFSNALFVCLGASAFIVLSLGSIRLAAVLNHPTLLFLGRISFSLYLFHPLCLFLMLSLLHGIVPLGLILAAVPVVAIVVASASYRWIEVPAIAAGRALTEKYAPRRASS